MFYATKDSFALRIISGQMILLFFLFIITTSFSAIVQADETANLSPQQLEKARDEIKRGIELYSDSDFNAAIKSLNKGLAILEKSINELKAQKELINAHLHLGLAYIGVNNMGLAKQQFQEIVRINPKYNLEKGAYSVKVISIFNEAKAQYLSKMMANDKKLSKEKKAANEAETTQTETSKQKKPIYKKWWFWGLVGGGTVVALAAASNKKSDDTSDTPLFSDSFDDGDFASWVPIDNAQYWSVQNQKLTHSTHDDWTIDEIQTGLNDWNVETFSADIGGFQGDLGNYEIFMSFGVQGASTYYYVSFNYGSIELNGTVDDEVVFDKNAQFPIQFGVFYNVTIEILNNRITVSVDDVNIFTQAITNSIKGRIGFAASSPTFAQYDNVEVWEASTSTSNAKSVRHLAKVHFRTVNSNFIKIPLNDKISINKFK